MHDRSLEPRSPGGEDTPTLRDEDMDLRSIDFTDLDNFAGGFPHDLFALHRRQSPVWWHAPTAHTPDGEGFWSVATYRETLDVLHNPSTYSSETGGDRRFGGTLLQDLPVAGVVLNMMDDPRHARIRRLVSTGLTARTLAGMEDEFRARARRLLTRLEPGAECDFVTEIASELPMQMICILLGIPEEDRHWLCQAVDPIFDARTGPTSAPAIASNATDGQQMLEYGVRLIAEKKSRSGDDMLSIVTHATLRDVDPPTLSDEELYAFFSLLFSAGSETTRHAIAGGLLALIERPEQLQSLRHHPYLLRGAIEEMLRWTTPSPAKRRTATTRGRLRGHVVEAGQKVLVWEGSANRDELAFERSMEFDINRDPNPHLSFGHGVHFCLGAHLARLEMRVLFEEMLPMLERCELVAPVEWTRSNRHTGLRHMVVRV
jgi:cytochrome P450